MKKTDSGCSAVLLGYYGFGSLGDEAVLGVIISSLSEKIEKRRICVIGRRSGKLGAVKVIGRKNIIAVLRVLFSARVLIIGGGSLLQDATSRRSLIYYCAAMRAAKLFRCRICIYANGIGPLKSEIRASRVLSVADRVSLRDPDSLKYAISLGADPAKTLLRADPVFAIRPESTETARLFLSVHGIGVRRFFAVSLRVCPGGRRPDTATVAAVCRRLSDGGLLPVFIPMENGYDREICDEASRLCGGVCLSIPDFATLSAVLRESEFAVGMRLHFLLSAAIAKIPFVALSYDCKVDSAVKYLGCGTLLDAYSLTYENLLTACRMAKSDARFSAALGKKLSALSALALSDAASLARDAGEMESTENAAFLKGRRAVPADGRAVPADGYAFR